MNMWCETKAKRQKWVARFDTPSADSTPRQRKK